MKTSFIRSTIGTLSLLMAGGQALGQQTTTTFDINPDMYFEYTFKDKGQTQTVAVDPGSCLNFGYGRPSFSAVIQGNRNSISATDANIRESLHLKGCAMAFKLGQQLDTLVVPISESERMQPLYTKNQGRQPLHMGVRARPFVHDTIKGEQLTVVHFLEKDVPKRFIFPLGACFNPQEQGEIHIDNGSRIATADLNRVRSLEPLKDLLAKACYSMVAPYILAFNNTEKLNSARHILRNAKLE